MNIDRAGRDTSWSPTWPFPAWALHAQLFPSKATKRRHNSYGKRK